jgi:cyanophycinase
MVRTFLIAACMCTSLPALTAQTTPATKVGPANGAVILASAPTPPILDRFIQLAGGPGATIVFIPTATLQKPGASLVYVPAGREAGGLKDRGATNIVVLHTFERTPADTDSFVEPLKRASGVWLAGGRPENLLDSYAGTKVETELRNVLARGGVVGGVSAGAMVLGSETVNSELGADRQWVVRKAFGLLRAVAFQPHAQNPRLDSWLLKRSDLARLASDNAAAWVIQKDVAEIVGDGKSYVFTDSAGPDGMPFITLRGGDRYDLARR